MSVSASAQTVPHARDSDESVIELGDETFLLIDRWGIETTDGVELRANPPRVRGPVFRTEKSWEQIENYTTVIDDGTGVYKMYYLNDTAGPRRVKRGTEEFVVPKGDSVWNYCVAISRDGVRWERRNVGQVEWEGSTENNICLQYMHGGSVFFDPHDVDPARRYKFFVSPRGFPDALSLPIFVYTSPDGFRWDVGVPVMPFIVDSQPVLQWDHNIERYVAYLRSHTGGRHVVRAVTEDAMQPWPTPSNPSPTREELTARRATFPEHVYPAVLKADDDDPPLTDLYNSQVFIYPWAHRVYFAFPTLFYKHAGPRRQLSPGIAGAGTGEVQLAVSRDGIRWTRYRRPAYLKGGWYGDHYSYWSWMFQGMIRRENVTYQYGCLRPYGHSVIQFVDGTVDAGSPSDRDSRRFTLFEQKNDRFVAAAFRYTGGTLVTQPIRFKGNRLVLNVDASGAGEGRVGLLRADGSSIAGFSVDDCDWVHGDWLTKTVSWQNGEVDIGELTRESLRLEFRMRGANLFSFRSTHVSTPPPEVSRVLAGDSFSQYRESIGGRPVELRSRIDRVWAVAGASGAGSASGRVVNGRLEIGPNHRACIEHIGSRGSYKKPRQFIVQAKLDVNNLKDDGDKLRGVGLGFFNGLLGAPRQFWGVVYTPKGELKLFYDDAVRKSRAGFPTKGRHLIAYMVDTETGTISNVEFDGNAVDFSGSDLAFTNSSLGRESGYTMTDFPGIAAWGTDFGQFGIVDDFRVVAVDSSAREN